MTNFSVEKSKRYLSEARTRLSEETRTRLSEARTRLSEAETRLSEETRTRLSDARTRLSEARTRLSEETRTHLSEARTRLSEAETRLVDWATDDRPPGLHIKHKVGKHLPDDLPSAAARFAKRLPERVPPAVSDFAKHLPDRLPPAVKAGKPDWLSNPLRSTVALSAGAALALGSIVAGAANAAQQSSEVGRTSVVSELIPLLEDGTEGGSSSDPHGPQEQKDAAGTGSPEGGGEPEEGEAPAEGEARAEGDAPAEDAGQAPAEEEAPEEQAPADDAAPAEEEAPAEEAEAPAEEAEAEAAEEEAPAPAEEPAPSVPLDDIWVTNPYGWRTNVNPLLPAGSAELHNGIDFGANTGTPVKSILPGTVTYAEYHQYGGLRIEVDHGDGTQSTYSHLNEILVEVGQQVDFNQVIGTVGSTGNSTGPHLHFELLRNGEYVDPAPLLGL